MLQSIIVGIFTILGVIVGIWFQAKNTIRTRMDEIIAEKKVTANNEAYVRIKTIASLLLQSSLEHVKNKMQEYEEWFFNTRLFLPGEFPNKWLTLRFNVSKALRLQLRLPEKAEELSKIEARLKDLTDEAIDEIYKEMKLSRMKIEGVSCKETVK